MKLTISYCCYIQGRFAGYIFDGRIILFPQLQHQRTFYFKVIRPYDGNSEMFVANDDTFNFTFADYFGEIRPGRGPDGRKEMPFWRLELPHKDPRYGTAHILRELIPHIVHDVAGRMQNKLSSPASLSSLEFESEIVRGKRYCNFKGKDIRLIGKSFKELLCLT